MQRSDHLFLIMKLFLLYYQYIERQRTRINLKEFFIHATRLQRIYTHVTCSHVSSSGILNIYTYVFELSGILSVVSLYLCIVFFESGFYIIKAVNFRRLCTSLITTFVCSLISFPGMIYLYYLLYV